MGGDGVSQDRERATPLRHPGNERLKPGANLATVIKGIENDMREAATNLEFEKAAKLRDEIKRLREMELDVLEGSVGTE